MYIKSEISLKDFYWWVGTIDHAGQFTEDELEEEE